MSVPWKVIVVPSVPARVSELLAVKVLPDPNVKVPVPAVHVLPLNVDVVIVDPEIVDPDIVAPEIVGLTRLLAGAKIWNTDPFHPIK